MVGAQLHGGVDGVDRVDAFIECVNCLVDHRHQHAVDDEGGEILGVGGGLASIQGRTLGAVSSLNSMVAVLAPLAGAGLLALVSDAPPGDLRLGLPLFAGSLIQITALVLAIWHFSQRRPAA